MSLLARSNILRRSATLTARVYLRSLSTLRSGQSAPCGVLSSYHAVSSLRPPCTSARRFSATPTFDAPTEDRQPSGTCFVTNLPYRVTAEQLKGAFSEFGKVESVRILTTDSGMSRGVAFVQFESIEDAINFVDSHAADPVFVLDRQLQVRHANKTRSPLQPADPCDTLMVFDFPVGSADEVRDMFGDYAHRIVDVRFDRREADRPRRAFVQFRDVDVATEAMEAFRNQGLNAQVRYARQRQTPANAYSFTSRLSRQQDQ